ncbi:putative Heat shock protein 70 family [Helianthus anomalus]
MKKQVNKLADKLKSDEKERIESAMKEALEWLVDNQLAERDEYFEKLEEVKVVCNPIITAVYQRSGWAPGGAAEDYDHEHDELYGRRWIVLISCLVSIILGRGVQ